MARGRRTFPERQATPEDSAIGGAAFRRGFAATVPLWLGAVPFGIAFALLAREAGLDPVQTQLCSALIFAGAAQVALVTLVADGAGPLAIVLTGLLLNLRHVLYGLSLRPNILLRTKVERWMAPLSLVDETYGLTVRAAATGRVSPAFLVGAGVGMYVLFNLATLAGSLAGTRLPDTLGWGLDVVFPLTFLALLVPLVRGRRHLLVAAVSAAAALALSTVLPTGATILVATVAAAGLGAGIAGKGARWN